MIFTPKMPPEYRCPNCHSEDLVEHGDYITCQKCHLEFHKPILESDTDEEDILSEEELDGLIDVFDEFKDDEKRKKFLDSLKDDFL